jgi:hypothetical protein
MAGIDFSVAQVASSIKQKRSLKTADFTLSGMVLFALSMKRVFADVFD